MDEKLPKRTIEAIKKLESGDKKLIMATLTSLRKTGNPSITPHIIALLKSNDVEIKQASTSFLNDLKEQATTPFIMDAIADKKYKNEKHILISACWQSDLNFTEYADKFVDIVINDDYATAFEAFTVLENISPEIDKKVIMKLTVKINNILGKSSEDKVPLLMELVKLLN